MKEYGKLVLKTDCVHNLNHLCYPDQLIYLSDSGESDNSSKVSIFKEEIKGKDRDKVQNEPPIEVLSCYFLYE